MHLRQNIVQAVIGEFLGVCRPTASRAIKALTEAIFRTPAVLLLTAEEVPEVVDGTLLPCPDWRRRRDPWSVKHGRAGMNVQILVRPNRGFVWAPGAPIRGLCATWPHWTPPDCWREWIPPDGSATRSISAGG